MKAFPALLTPRIIGFNRVEDELLERLRLLAAGNSPLVHLRGLALSVGHLLEDPFFKRNKYFYTLYMRELQVLRSNYPTDLVVAVFTLDEQHPIELVSPLPSP